MNLKNSLKLQRRRDAEKNEDFFERGMCHPTGDELKFFNTLFFRISLRLRASAVRLLG